MRPSQDFQWINSGSGKSDVLRPPVSLKVQRSTLPVWTSSEKTSELERAEERLKPRSRLFLCHCTPEITPLGRLGTDFSLRVFVSNRCSTPKPSSLTTNAIVFPSSERSNSSTSHGILLVR